MSNLNHNMNAIWHKNAGLVTKLIAGLLLLLALYFVAKMAWLWVDYAQDKELTINSGTSVSQVKPTKNINANRIAQMHLFGTANQQAAVIEETVGETSLNLKLLGVYVSSEPGNSSAIIQTGGNKEKVYWLDEKLENVGSRKVTLKRVEVLKVIINNNGKNETLTLLEKLNEKIIGSKTSSKVASNKERDGKTIDKRNDSRLSKDLSDIREKLASSPESYSDIANFEPVVDNSGQVSGFKVSPGKNVDMFTRLGLRRNDVVKSINGEGMDNQAYWTALSQLQSAESLEVTIERNGQPVTILLNLGGGNSGRQNQQRDNRPRNTNQPVIK